MPGQGRRGLNLPVIIGGLYMAVETICYAQQLRNKVSSLRRQGKTIGIVPTMGALHAGHASLLTRARQDCDVLVVSIFVNPIQFNQAADLENYPRTWEADMALCQQIGVDIVYAPEAQDMYPPGFQSKVCLNSITQPMEGAGRPGHFDGVATVVSKLFNASMADFAWFGEKDFQQLKMVTQMVKDMDMGVQIVAVPTVREKDGLALSSRNRRLNAAQRQDALSLSRALQTMITAARQGQHQVEDLLVLGRQELAKSVVLEYLEVVDATTLERLVRLHGNSRALIAAQVGPVRLIDNMDISI